MRLLLAALLAIGWTVVVAENSAADGPTTFSNSTAIAIPATGSPVTFTATVKAGGNLGSPVALNGSGIAPAAPRPTWTPQI
jgi:hypothetical protein